MSDKQPLGPLQQKWVEELRSGKHGQTIGVMMTAPVNEPTPFYCCLGLAAEHVLGMVPTIWSMPRDEEIEDGEYKFDQEYYTYEASGSQDRFGTFGEKTDRGDPSIELVDYERLGLFSPTGKFNPNWGVNEDGVYHPEETGYATSLSELNDEEILNFSQIAEIMEKYPSLIFKEPK